ncbi:MAG: hypothetical protein K6B46_06600 [Opitutales bacterium]|nr:hypothetical protein [Opitutales bacterium]
MKIALSTIVLTLIHFILVLVQYTGHLPSIVFKVIGQPGIWVANAMGWYGWGTAEGSLATIGAFATGGANPQWPLSFWLCMLATSVVWGVVLGFALQLVFKKK